MKDELYARSMDRVRELLALEYNCVPEDFQRWENTLTLSAVRPGQRDYGDRPYFFHMATFGGCAVITAAQELQDYLRGFMADRMGHWLFEFPNLLPLERELEKYGYRLSSTFHMFLPTSTKGPAPEFPVRWFREEEIRQFYGDPRFPNAILDSYHPERPDRLAVCAYDGERIMGMAGCSEDAPGWFQIGIDVEQEYRSRGVGTGLVSLLKERVLETGGIPFYGTAVAGYHSRNVALNCGFRPAWVEIGAKRLDIEN